MNIWKETAPERVAPDRFIAVVEISKASKCKYELDKSTGLLILDRILYTSTHYPANYGFIPLTLADDGDPLDVLILCSEALLPLSLVECRPIGMITMLDGGRNDEKVIAVPLTDPNYNGYQNVEELPKHIFDEMVHFFAVYKQLENKTTAVNELMSVEEAKSVIKSSIESFKIYVK